VAACKSNFSTLAAVARALGGIPEATFGAVEAMSGGADTRVVAGYLLFLCARLLSHRREEAGLKP
jgi:abnormal spindle-like microcephaly-associated protein